MNKSDNKIIVQKNNIPKEYSLSVAGLTRTLPVCPINESLYIAGFVIFGDVELTKACAAALCERLPCHDYIITAESKGIPLAYEMSSILGNRQYFVARKAKKLYMNDPIGISVQSISTAKEQKLYLDKADADKIYGKRIVIVDDVISTGESLKALEQLVLKAGGIIEAKMAILAEGDAAERDDIIFLEKLPLIFANNI